MKNHLVSETFTSIADILEIKGENPFRIRAYRRAALNIESLSEDIEDIANRDGLKDIPGIGEDLAKKIKELVSTGSLEYLDKLKKEIPQGVLDLMSIPSVGPKKAKLLYDNLNIKSIDELEKAARKHKLSGLPGLKDKTEENILKGIGIIKKSKERVPLGNALPLALEIIGELKKLKAVKKISYAGSVRRMKETIHDIDILIASDKPALVMDKFVKLPLIERVLAKGETKSSALTKDKMQVDMRVVAPKSYGAALVYFTGSKQHNIKIRERAVRMKLKVNEYGVFKEPSEKWIAGETEEDVYKALKLSLVPPEMREDQGEIEAASAGRLPKLIETKDIKGDFHIHSKWSDGGNSIEELAKAAIARGYEYIAICDHSVGLKVAGGVPEKELLKHIKDIRQLNKKLKGFKILTGAEVDINSDGSLDYKDDILRELDFAIAAIHIGFKQSRDVLTSRILKAMDNRYVRSIAHPTGRLMGVRDAYELDFDKVFKAARETNTHLEINAYPQRLDLTDINVRRAKGFGAPLVIATDSHITEQLDNMAFGVAVARRGWCEKKDVLNTYSLAEVLKRIRK